MKYYKKIKNLITTTANHEFDNYYKIGVIFPGNTTRNSTADMLMDVVYRNSNYFEEVPEIDYYFQEGKIPEYFAIKRVEGNPLWKKYIDWLNATYGDTLYGLCNTYYGYEGQSEKNTGLNFHLHIRYFKNKPVELTLEQWDKIVNKNIMEENKEIIGYKVKPEFKQAANMLLVVGTGISQDNLVLHKNNISKFKELGVLELWFEPVFAPEKPKFPQIEVNGYKGEFFDNYVKFGCAEMQKNLFTDLYRWIEGSAEHTNRNIEFVTIGKGVFTKEQIKEIAEYYLDKK